MVDIDTPVPVTWNSDDLIKASDLNEQIRDALEFLVSGCACSVSLHGTQSIPNNSATAITWDSQLDDVDDIITVPGSTFTFARDGIISVRSYITFDNASAGKREHQIALNGTNVSAAGGSGTITNSHGSGVCHSADVAVLAGDTMQILAFQTSGAALNLIADGSVATLSWAGKTEDFTNFDEPIPDVPDPSNPPSSAPTKHVTSYGAQWSRSYEDGNGTLQGDPSYCYQGRYSNKYGHKKSLIGFDWREIKSDLRHATRISCKLSVYTAFSTLDGVSLIIGGHDYDNKPSVWTLGRVTRNIQRNWVVKDKRSTVKLNSQFVRKFKTGEFKGIALGPAPNKRDRFYGFVNGATRSNKPRLEFTYWK